MDSTIRIRTAAWYATAIVLSVVCTLLVTQAWSADAAPGDTDSTFVPTAGCRLVDTRTAPNTVGLRSAPLGAGEVFEVTVHGANGDCTGGLAIPADAVAVALNVTAVNATATSNIRVYPANLTEVPTLSNLNVTAGAPPTPNKVDVKLSPDGKIRVYNFRGTVNIFIDVVGYYTNSTLKELAAGLAAANSKTAALETALEAARPPFALVAADGTLTAGYRVVSVSRLSAGVYNVRFNRSVAECAKTATIGSGNGEPAGVIDTVIPASDTVRVITESNDGVPPAFQDRAFNLVVNC